MTRDTIVQNCPVAPFSVDELYSEEVARCPFPIFSKLQQEGPVHQVDDLPWYIVTRFDDCTKVLLDAENFSSEHRGFGPAMKAIGMTPPPGVLEEMKQIGGERGALFDIVVHQDPPAHSRLRRLLNKLLPGHFNRWKPSIEERTAQLLARLPREGEMEFIRDFAAPLPIAVIADILGLPEDIHGSIRSWSDHAADVSGRRASPEVWLRMAKAMADQRAYFVDQIERRLETPPSDLLGDLAALTRKDDPEAGLPITLDEAVELSVMLLVGGNETTTQMLAGMMYELAIRPGLLERIRNEPELINNVVEEALRVHTPVQTIMRFCRKAAKIGDIVIPEGAIVSLFVAQASRDGEVFDDPDTFDPARPNARRHLAFSTGIHHCSGADLTRAEGRVALKQICDAFESVSLSNQDSVRYDRATLIIKGMSSLGIRFRRRR